MNNSLDQYTRLFDQQRPLIDSHAPELMNRWRTPARRALVNATLPTTATEGYERTSINDMFAPDLGLNLNRLNFQADVASTFKCDIPNMSTLLGVVVNDVFHPTATLLKNLPDGVIFGSMAAVAAERPELFERYYGCVAPLDNPAVALNTMLAQDGVVVYIPDGVELQKPLQLVNIFAATQGLVAFRRILVIVGDNARGQLLLCDHTQHSDAHFVDSQVIEVILGHNSVFDLYDIEKSNALTSRHSMTFVRQAEGSNFLLNSTTLTCGVTRNEMTVDLDGELCEARMTGMAIATGEQHVDNSTALNHRAPRCRSNQLFKYVIEDRAVGAFEGTILVDSRAPYTEAYQSNKNIVASTMAKMHTKPQLLIYNDEVKCSHGATTGQLDEEALFYMRTRGIPAQEARNMLMQAFMIDVIDSVRLESLRDRLRHLVEKRFDGDSANCETCNLNSDKK